MMKRLFSITAATAALLATTHLAHADAEGDRRIARDKASNVLGDSAKAIDQLQRNGTFASTENMPKLGDCLQAVKDAAAAGLKDSDNLSSQWFEVYPGKDGGAVAPDVGNVWTMPLSKAKGICSRYEGLRRLVDAAKPLEKFWEQASNTKREAAEFLTLITDDNQWTSWMAMGEQCKQTVEAAVDAGAPSDVAVSFRGTENLTLGEFETKICQPLIDWATRMSVEVPKLKKARLAEMAAVYKKAGAKGDKLEWLVDRGPGIDGWYLKGCKEPKDVKQLVKASVWFQWFYPPDGGHMIRRIQFKGNKQVKVTERTYETEAKAYKGCK